MNPIFLKIGNISIYWYSIFILIGILTACTIVLREANKKNILSQAQRMGARTRV